MRPHSPCYELPTDVMHFAQGAASISSDRALEPLSGKRRGSKNGHGSEEEQGDLSLAFGDPNIEYPDQFLGDESENSADEGEALLSQRSLFANPVHRARNAHFRSLLYIVVLNASLATAYYSIVSVIAIFFHQTLGYTEEMASFFTNTLNFSNFLLSVVGGLAADSKLGRFNTIVVGTFIAILGYFSLYLSTVFVDEHGHYNHGFIFFSLLLITLGNGSVTPCLSSFVGDQLKPKLESSFEPGEQEQANELVSGFYRFFYISFNIGAVFGMFLTPLIVQYASYRWAFGLLLVIVVISLPLFLIGTAEYVRVEPMSVPLKRVVGKGTANRSSLGRILRLFLPLPVFWALFYNMPSLWVMSATHMDRRVGEYVVPAGQMVVLNPLFDILLTPLFHFHIFPLIKSHGYDFHEVRRMIVGMICTCLALFVAGVVEIYMSSHHVSVLWQIPQYLLMSCGEILVSVTGLELAFTHAPDELKGIVMALFFLTQAIGNELVAVVALIGLSEPALDYFLFGGVMMLFLFIFMYFTWNFLGTRGEERKERHEEDDELYDYSDGWEYDDSDYTSASEQGVDVTGVGRAGELSASGPDDDGLVRSEGRSYAASSGSNSSYVEVETS